MQPSGSNALLLGGSLRWNRLVLGGMVVWLLLSATGAAAVAAASMSLAAALVSSALPSSRTTSLLLPTSCYRQKDDGRGKKRRVRGRAQAKKLTILNAAPLYSILRSHAVKKSWKLRRIFFLSQCQK